MNKHHRARTSIFTLTALAAALMTSAASAVPPRGSTAPAISLQNLRGEKVSSADLAPRPLVLIFGEMNNEGTRLACADVLNILKDPRLEEGAIVPILLVAQDTKSARADGATGPEGFPRVILRDPDREAFGAYHILVIPTIVIVDGAGKVVYAAPAYQQKSRDLITEAVMVAAGKETAEQFNQAVEPAAAGPDHDTVRADRLVHLAAELARHELYEMAEARYSEAISLAPGHAGATIGLGKLMLKRGRLDQAEGLFRAVLAADPGSVDATLGIAEVQVARGGDDLAKAEATIREVVNRSPRNPRARYLLGLVNERQGNYAAAMAEFRIATEVLLDD
ncbi:MAG: tetratricopeptide repeat protein [Phycisphaerales bacterium]|nr:tetratricopeptide repeat protein [Phycisphaerales bacterium]